MSDTSPTLPVIKAGQGRTDEEVCRSADVAFNFFLFAGSAFVVGLYIGVPVALFVKSLLP